MKTFRKCKKHSIEHSNVYLGHHLLITVRVINLAKGHLLGKANDFLKTIIFFPTIWLVTNRKF